ncbi:hypothetical protein Tco_0317584 [Tanacetum coccineum]
MAAFYRIVLRVADTYEYLYKPCPDQPPETATAEEKAAWKAEYKKHSDVANVLWGSIYCIWGYGAQAVVDAIGSVVSFSCLLDLGFKHTVASNGISVSLNGVFYFSAISVNDMCQGRFSKAEKLDLHLEEIKALDPIVDSYNVAVRCTGQMWRLRQNLVQSRYQQNPGSLTGLTVNLILNYMRNTKVWLLVYGENPIRTLMLQVSVNWKRHEADYHCDACDTICDTWLRLKLQLEAVD